MFAINTFLTDAVALLYCRPSTSATFFSAAAQTHPCGGGVISTDIKKIPEKSGKDMDLKRRAVLKVASRKGSPATDVFTS